MEVKDPHPFGISYPQPAKLIFHYIAAAVGQETETDISSQTEVEKSVSVIAHESATMSGYPHKTIGVTIYIINIVARHTRVKIQIADIILRQGVSVRYRWRNQK